MAEYLTTDTDLTSVADAIRTKGGTSAQLTFPSGFISAIEAIPTGGGVETVTVSISDSQYIGFTVTYFDNNGTYREASGDYDPETEVLKWEDNLNVGSMVDVGGTTPAPLPFDMVNLAYGGTTEFPISIGMSSYIHHYIVTDE